MYRQPVEAAGHDKGLECLGTCMLLALSTAWLYSVAFSTLSHSFRYQSSPTRNDN